MRRLLAALAALGGVLALFAGSPYRVHDVGAVELAQWIHDRKPGLRVIDLRAPAAFAGYHLPRAENVTLESVPARADETIVLIADGIVPAPPDHRQIFVLRGGVRAWLDEVLAPKNASRQAKELSRYFGGPRRGGC